MSAINNTITFDDVTANPAGTVAVLDDIFDGLRTGKYTLDTFTNALNKVNGALFSNRDLDSLNTHRDSIVTVYAASGHPGVTANLPLDVCANSALMDFWRGVFDTLSW